MWLFVITIKKTLFSINVHCTRQISYESEASGRKRKVDLRGPLPSQFRQFKKNVLCHNLLWERVMSVKVYIFGKGITRSIYGLECYPKSCIFEKIIYIYIYFCFCPKLLWVPLNILFLITNCYPMLWNKSSDGYFICSN